MRNRQAASRRASSQWHADEEQRSWDRWLPRLEEFRRRFGHCRVPQGWREDPALATWVHRVRARAGQGRLAAPRRAALEKLGFDFAVFESNWSAMLEELARYRFRFGHTLVPKTWRENPRLGAWVLNRRREFRRGVLSEQRIRELEALGFEWSAEDARHRRKLTAWEQAGGAGPAPVRRSEIVRTTPEQRWDKRIQELRAYGEEHGGFASMRRCAPTMQEWVDNKRVRWREGRLSRSQIRDLSSLGFRPDDPRDAQFKAMFARLAAFQKRFGHCDVPYKWPEDAQLGKWVAKTRSRSRNGAISEDRVRALERLGFEFNPNDAEWRLCFEALRDFQQRVGHCRVPKAWPESPGLAAWVSGQRSRRDRLSRARRELLESIGFSWNSQEDTWNESFRAAEHFSKLHGHLRVPVDWPAHPTLCNWVAQQRNLKRLGKLRPDRERRLRQLGIEFDRNQHDHSFEMRLRELERYRREHGDCRVPRKYPGGLGTWLIMVRGFIRKGRVVESRLKRLAELGVTGRDERRKRDSSTGPELSRALEFRRRHGHFAIPATDATLFAWASLQRWHASRGSLSPGLRRELERHGFPLTDRELVWEQRFAAIQSFSRRNGHWRIPPGSELNQWLARQRSLARRGKLEPDREERLAAIGALGTTDRAAS